MDGSRTGNREREIEGEDRRSIHLQDKSIGRCQRWNSKLSKWYKIRCVLCTGKLATTPPSTPTPFSTVDQGNQAAKNSKTVVRKNRLVQRIALLSIRQRNDDTEPKAGTRAVQQ